MAGIMNEARRLKNDEFYTLEEDIQREVDKYKEQLKDKIIYCNCDDYRESNFLKYLGRNFVFFGLKKLICSSYKKGETSVKYYTIEVNEPVEQDIYFNTWQDYIRERDLESDGDFRSEASIELLEEADIVITNPPFSLFREFIAQLIKYNKKFLILGNSNAITSHEIFPLIKDNKIWYGYDNNKTMEFIMPDTYKLKGKAYIDENGKKHGFVPSITWFTNLDVQIRHEMFELIPMYDLILNGIEFPHYDNYDAINIDKVINIPSDYTGIMGVPITFLSKYNPDLFEIIGCAHANILPEGWKGMSENFVKLYYEQGNTGSYKPGNRLNAYIKNGKAIVPYARILIRNKHPEVVEEEE